MDKKDIIKLFSERKEIYGEMTTILFSQFDRCLSTIESAFGGILKNFVWVDIDYDEHDNVIVFFCMADYESDNITITSQGGNVTNISTLDENGNKQKKEIHVGMPIELTLDGTDEDIYNFFMYDKLDEGQNGDDMVFIENRNGDIVSYNLIDQQMDSKIDESDDFITSSDISPKRILH